MKIVDWDGDGKKDVVASYSAPQNERSLNEFHFIRFYKNTDKDADPWSFALAEGVALEAGGKAIDVHSPDVECADFDADGDLDLFAAAQNADVYFYENTGSKPHRSWPQHARSVRRIKRKAADIPESPWPISTATD